MLSEEQTIEELVGKVEFPPLDVVKFGYAPDTPLPVLADYRGGMRGRPDLMLEFEWQGERQQFVVELKRRSTPSDLDNAIQQLKRYRKSMRSLWPEGEIQLMLMFPYLSPEALDR